MSVLLRISLLMAATVSPLCYASTASDADRQAILAMAGDFEVRFHFQETVALAPGYQTKPAKDSGAYEQVLVLEDQGTRIVLQHLLVDKKGHVTKHWRQDWTFEARERFEFTADQTWEIKRLDETEHRGTWTQCVFEVSDAPRYCGTGRWRHAYGQPTWTSDRSWRPLPRREYTQRDDYNAINAENRHTITPNGWTHEQDNSKVVRKADGSQVLTREFGFNDYRRTDKVDFAPITAYWTKTQAFWAQVRAIWNERLHEHGWLHLETPVHGMPIITGLFTLAESNVDAKPDVIANVIRAHTRTTPEAKTQADTTLTQVSQ
ncbi:hypothetical protein C7S18_14570 [Ahniella affigens]|uniref:Secreted protein n=1 Tax=Ahniella affigens TaxID=2021234 RepID=A0A2P1PU19_9GAMM|nr:DUF6607 family protein [Ahniella affigens]AVP98338.1 hypothetical protein C7S18_14570 [Ahniella affigens]